MKTIKELPEHDRPREKMREKGATALTNEELVQVILGPRRQGLRCARHVAEDLPGFWRRRKAGLHESDLKEIHGMGEAKSYQLACRL